MLQSYRNMVPMEESTRIQEQFDATSKLVNLNKFLFATYVMFSGWVAQAPTALVTLTRRAWLVPISRLTSGWIPPHLRIVARFSGICAHSPKAPTTLTSTSSGWSLRRLTRVSKALYSWNLRKKKETELKQLNKTIWYRCNFSSSSSTLTSERGSNVIMPQLFPRYSQYTLTLNDHIFWFGAGWREHLVWLGFVCQVVKAYNVVKESLNKSLMYGEAIRLCLFTVTVLAKRPSSPLQRVQGHLAPVKVHQTFS